MMSMDAEAEMEGLFGGEDQGQDDAEATQSLTQEGQLHICTKLVTFIAIISYFRARGRRGQP